jgi:DNA mismatch repair protein MutL
VAANRANQLGMDMDMQEPGQYSKQSPSEEAASEAPARRRKIPMMRVIGQAGATYIVTEGPGGLYLIDQHAAHERILYEQFLAEQGSEDVASQELLEALTVELLPEQMALVAENMDGLHELGFVVEDFGRNTVLLRAVPAILAGSEPVDGLLAAIGQYDSEDMPTGTTSQERLAARICKQAAVKAGQTLSFAEMQAMIRQLENCEAPQTDPQGQPTMIHISAEQLAREFGRLNER